MKNINKNGIKSHNIRKGKVLKNGLIAICLAFIIGLNTNIYNIENCV